MKNGNRSTEQGENHGEGNPEAADRFNKAEQKFVRSRRGQRKISEAGNVRPDEEAQLEEAERVSRSQPTDSAAKAAPVNESPTPKGRRP